MQVMKLFFVQFSPFSCRYLRLGMLLSVEWLNYATDDPRFELRQGNEIYLFSKASRPALGPIQLHINP